MFSLSVTALRPPPPTKRSSLLRECRALVPLTKYKYLAKDHEAPAITNCITALRYIFKKCALPALPPVWIGDMPRILVTQCDYSLHVVATAALVPGDLLFAKRRTKGGLEDREIVHVVMALGDNLIFHSSEGPGGGVVEALTHRMMQRTLHEPERLLSYIDPRNTPLRALFPDGYFRELPPNVRALIHSYL